MKQKHKRKRRNPGRGPCEYCHLLNQQYVKDLSPKARRRILARFKLHRKAMHNNPSLAYRHMMKPPRRTRIAKIAIKIAFKLFHHFKGKGVPRFIIQKIPSEIRPYVVDILSYNGIRVVETNPFF